MAFEELLERAGGVGLFQVLQVATMLLPALFTSPNLLLENFSAISPSHRCWTHWLDNGSRVPANLTREALLAVSIPLGPDRQPHRCRRFRHPQWQLLDPNATAPNGSEAATEPCVDGWVYDYSTFTSTTVTTWDLVCSEQHLTPLGKSIYMAGVLTGTLIWGFLSCRLGRKPILSWCCLQTGVAGASTFLAPNFPIYCGLRFLSAFGLAGVILTTTPMMAEWTTTRWRAFTLMVQGCTYSMGQMGLAGLGFALRDWRALQLAVSVPFLLVFLISWWLPESARWLIIRGKPDQALGELQKVARINGSKGAEKTLTIEVLRSSMEEGVASAESQRSVLDLFRVPILARRLYAMLLVSFCLQLSYYGLVLDLQSLGGDLFLLQALFGAVDIVARATTTVTLRFLGRRRTLAGTQALAGLFILANVLVPQDLQTLRVSLAVLGKGCFGISLTTLTVYQTELFPTSLRMTSNGLQQTVGRVGAIASPLLKMAHQTLPLLPPLSYGTIPIVSSLVILLSLPETQEQPLPDSVQNLESQRPSAARGNQIQVTVTQSTWL